jgi:peptidoglycan/LPS O-acetylase OafA/YrhL
VTQKLNTERVLFAQYLRGIACLSVLISHLALSFWLNKTASTLANTPAYTGPIPPIIYSISFTDFINYGPFGVGLFFLISGFVIPLSLQKYNSLQFLIARFFRIVPTYLVGFAITISALGVASIYYGRIFMYPVYNVILNAFLIRDLVWIPSIDAVAWTLEIEIKFYILCAIIIWWIKRNEYRKILLLCFILSLGLELVNQAYGMIPISPIAVLSNIYQFDVPFVIFMFIGTMIYFCFSSKIALKEMILAILILFSLFIFGGILGPFKDYPDPLFNGVLPYFMALCIFLFCFGYSYLITYIPLKKITWNPLLKSIKIVEKGLAFFADISYPLYIVHGVTNYVFMRILLDFGIRPELVLAIAISDSIIIAYLIHVYVEIPSNIFGKKISSMIRNENFQK